MKIGELFMALGFDVDDEKLGSFDKKIESLKTNMVMTAAKTTAVIWAIDRFTAGSIRAAAALANFNSQTNLSADRLQKWQAIAQMKNLAASADTVLGSVKSLQDNLTQIRLGGGNVTPFQMLGIDVRGQDAFQVLEQIRERIQGLDRPIAVNLLQQLGIDPTMLETLMLARGEFEALGDEFKRSQETTDRLMKLGFSIQMLKMRFSLWKDEFVAYIAPILEGAINIFYRFHEAVLNVKAAIDRNPEAWERMKKGLLLIAGAFVVLLAALNPVKAALLLLFLLIDDYASYLNGKNSVFGSMIDEAMKLSEWVWSVIDGIKWLIAHGSMASDWVAGNKQSEDGAATRFTPEQLSLALTRIPAAKSGNTVTMNNTINVEVSGNTAYDDFTRRLQVEMNSLWDKSMGSTLADFNNGGR